MRSVFCVEPGRGNPCQCPKPWQAFAEPKLGFNSIEQLKVWFDASGLRMEDCHLAEYEVDADDVVFEGPKVTFFGGQKLHILGWINFLDPESPMAAAVCDICGEVAPRIDVVRMGDGHAHPECITKANI